MYFTDLHRISGENRTVLSGEDAYKQYFTYLETVFQKVIATYLLDVEGKQDEVVLLRHYLSMMLNSINAFRSKYLFDEGVKLSIDQSDSSFPSAGEFTMLQYDITQRIEQLEKMKPKAVLIQSLLQAIFGLRKEYRDIQLKLATRHYFESLGQMDYFFLPFTKGYLSRFDSTGIRKKYRYHWGAIEETLSVPLIYDIVFETTEDYESDDGKKYYDQFLKILAYASKGLGELISVAQILERECEDVYPKSLKRLIVGPIFGKYSAGSTKIGCYIKSLDSTDAFALNVQSESLVSQNEVQLKRKVKAQQEYEFGQSPEIIFRQVTDFRELLFTPHDIGQRLLAEKELADEVLRTNIISLHN